MKQFYKIKLREVIKILASHLGSVAIRDDVILDYAFQLLLHRQIVLDAQRKKIKIVPVLQIKIYLSQFNTCVLV